MEVAKLELHQMGLDMPCCQIRNHRTTIRLPQGNANPEVRIAVNGREFPQDCMVDYQTWGDPLSNGSVLLEKLKRVFERPEGSSLAAK